MLIYNLLLKQNCEQSNMKSFRISMQQLSFREDFKRKLKLKEKSAKKS